MLAESEKAQGFVRIAGLPVSTASLDEHVDLLRRWMAARRGGWVVTLNTEMVARCARDPAYRALLEEASLVVADGMPIVWASRHGDGSGIPDRTTGVELVERLLRADPGPPFAVIGGRAPHAAVRELCGGRDGCRWIYQGTVDTSEECVGFLHRQLGARDVRIAFLALGVPKQDLVGSLLSRRLPQTVFVGVGGAFEMLGPDGRRAPAWMQDAGLEWAFRLGREPARLWPRYLLRYPLGLMSLGLERVRRRRPH
jgi:N-acetylglucosaminyldiphosphoundecaprenol N-acetyl-beta-D-mannosaminyltransferase